MIHKTMVAPTTVIEKVQGEVIAPPTLSVTPQREYSHRTLFQGNGRRLLWDGLGSDVSEANSAYEVCKIAGLDFHVQTEGVFTADGVRIPNMVVTRRYDVVDDVMIPSTVYGAVTERYTTVQNYDGFEFIDTLFGHNGFEVETAAQFVDGKIVWIEARLPQRDMVGEKIDPYLVFTNRHDGKGSVRIFLTPVRVICRNTLNLAIKKAQGRTFSVRHTTTAQTKLEAAKETLNNYYAYLDAMQETIERQKRILISDNHLDQMIEKLLQFKEDDTDRVKQRVLRDRAELKRYYNNSYDLDGYEKSGFRFVNAVSDWATHREPSRRTANYASNLFQNTIEGNPFIDAAYAMVDEMEPTVSISMA